MRRQSRRSGQGQAPAAALNRLFSTGNADRPDSDGPPIEGGHARARAGRPRRDPRRKWVSCNSKQWGLSLRDVEGLDDSYQSRGEADDTASESSPTLVGIFTFLLLETIVWPVGLKRWAGRPMFGRSVIGGWRIGWANWPRHEGIDAAACVVAGDELAIVFDTDHFPVGCRVGTAVGH